MNLHLSCTSLGNLWDQTNNNNNWLMIFHMSSRRDTFSFYCLKTSNCGNIPNSTLQHQPTTWVSTLRDGKIRQDLLYQLEKEDYHSVTPDSVARSSLLFPECNISFLARVTESKTFLVHTRNIIIERSRTIGVWDCPTHFSQLYLFNFWSFWRISTHSFLILFSSPIPDVLFLTFGVSLHFLTISWEWYNHNQFQLL